MTTECYAMVRGSAIRVTGLGKGGRVPERVQYATSKSVARVTINEVVEGQANETIENPEEERRLHFVKADQTIRYKADIEFLRVDPELFSLVTGTKLVSKPVAGGDDVGFGTGPFGITAFGGDGDSVVGGFDSGTHLPTVSFGLEVWSKLTDQRCDNGEQAWGYTLFPHLRGGYLSGFTFQNGLVNFTLLGAQTRRSAWWGTGPHDLTGPYERLEQPVSRNVAWRTFITPASPPEENCGITITHDVLDNGTATDPMPDPEAALTVDSGHATTSHWIIDGGHA